MTGRRGKFKDVTFDSSRRRDKEVMNQFRVKEEYKKTPATKTDLGEEKGEGRRRETSVSNKLKMA